MRFELELIVTSVSLPRSEDRRLGSVRQEMALPRTAPRQASILYSDSTFQIRFAQKCTFCVSEIATSNTEFSQQRRFGNPYSAWAAIQPARFLGLAFAAYFKTVKSWAPANCKIDGNWPLDSTAMSVLQEALCTFPLVHR